GGGLSDRPGLPVDQREGHASLRQEIGQHEAAGPGAYHQDVSSHRAASMPSTEARTASKPRPEGPGQAASGARHQVPQLGALDGVNAISGPTSAFFVAR